MAMVGGGKTMDAATLAATLGVESDCAGALQRALVTTVRKAAASDEEIVRRLQARERMMWGRFRFELARELAPMFTQRFPQIRSVHLWEMDEADPEAADAPADPSLDLVLRLERNVSGLDELSVGIAEELARLFSERVPETPLVMTVHPVTRAMILSARGLGALFHSLHQPLILIWSPAG
jgi:hypothetical protein